MNVKNIIFDLGGVLVGLDPQRCIKAFGQVGCPQVARYVAEHSVTDLFLEAELGHIPQTQFCDEVRRICQCDTADADIVWAWNRLLTSISDERKQRLLQLRRSGCTLYLLSNTNVMHWQYCRDHLFPYRQCQVGNYFKHVFLSYEMHMCKPHPDIFRAVLDEAGIEATDTLFIDDSQANCDAAATLGLSTYCNQHIDDWLSLL